MLENKKSSLCEHNNMEWKMIGKLEEEEEAEEKEEGEERRWGGGAPQLESIYIMKSLSSFPQKQRAGEWRLQTWHERRTNEEMHNQRAHLHADRFSGGRGKRRGDRNPQRRWERDHSEESGAQPEDTELKIRGWRGQPWVSQGGLLIRKWF